MPNVTTTKRPLLTIVPADEPAGLCPTLLFDGEPIHDRRQPYTELLALDGAEPDLVILFGVGLAYTAAGARRMFPAARVVAYEPVPEMAEIARRFLRDEWRLEGVLVDQDLADFSARLIAAIPGARAAAVVELEALARLVPDEAAAFRAVVRETIDASTQTKVVPPASAEAWANIILAAPRLAGDPTLASCADALAGRPGLVVCAPPDGPGAAPLRALARSCCVVAAADTAAALHAAGVPVDVVVARGPVPADGAPWLAGAALLAAPEASPSWRAVPAAARLLFPHAGTAFALPEEAGARAAGFAFGDELPLVHAALTLGLGPIFVSGRRDDADASWNLLAPSARRDALLRRRSAVSGVPIRDVPENPEATATPPAPPRRFAEALADRGRALGAEAVACAVAAAGERIDALVDEAALIVPQRRAEYLARRAAGDALAQVVVAGAGLGAASGLGGLEKSAAAAQVLLRHVAEALGAPARRTTVVPFHTADEAPVRVFVGGENEAPAASRALRAALAAELGPRGDVRSLDRELAAALGDEAAAIPAAARPLLVARLCRGKGRAVYIEPSALPLRGLDRLARGEMRGFAALVPAEGPASIALIDAAHPAFAGPELEARLAQGLGLAARGDLFAGELPAEWSWRDQAPLGAAAVRFTCPEWAPWRSDLHPCAYLWAARCGLAPRPVAARPAATRPISAAR